MRPARRSTPRAGPRPSPVVNRSESSALTPAAIALKFSSISLVGFIDCLKSRAYFAQMSVKVAAHDVENFDDERITHGVENLVTDFTVNENVLCPQYGEMLRGICLLDTEPLDQRSCR